MSECPSQPHVVKMFCPYCQHAVLPSDTNISGDDHRWCFVRMATKGLIKGETPAEKRDSWIAICSAHVPPKAKVRRVKLTHAQRIATVPGPYYW
jgi:hypothetical protein